MGTDSVIYIRTDGNSKIATGHLVRCLCIAQALEKSGKKVCFLVSDNTSYELLKDLCNSIFCGIQFSFEIKIIESAAFDNLELEIEELCNLFDVSKLSNNTNNNISIDSDNTKNAQPLDKPMILVDSYYVTPKYFEALKSVAHVVYMDDLRAFDYDVDIVINYDVIPSSKAEEYKQSYTNAKACLLGAEYTPLREQFQNQKISLREKVQNILITTGGSDPYHFCEFFTSFLMSQKPDLEIHIVVGRLFDNIKTLETLSTKNSKIHLHQNVKDMASLMKQCDFAISAAGTTLYELCALGIPAISFTFADNQIVMAKTFDETGAVPYAGDLRDNCNLLSPDSTDTEMSTIYNQILIHLNSMLYNYNQRLTQQQIMKHQTDGNGAIKIANAIMQLLHAN